MGHGIRSSRCPRSLLQGSHTGRGRRGRSGARSSPNPLPMRPTLERGPRRAVSGCLELTSCLSSLTELARSSRSGGLLCLWSGNPGSGRHSEWGILSSPPSPAHFLFRNLGLPSSCHSCHPLILATLDSFSSSHYLSPQQPPPLLSGVFVPFNL